MKFAAIDFETANHRSDSPCQVAVVLVDDGQRVVERSWLIRPKNLYFSQRCIAVHGIRPRDVLDQPEWDQIWCELSSILDGQLLIAHNAMFDMAVLSSTQAAYELVCPAIEFQCTRLIARRCWPGRTGYGLKPTAEALGITFRHHDALEDARACAEVALAAAKASGVNCIEDLERQLSIRRGRIEYGNRIGPRCIRRGKAKSPNEDFRKGKPVRLSRSLQARTLLDGCQGIRPFENKRFFLTGSLLGLNRGETEAFLAELGGIVDLQLTANTDFWIVGSPELQDPSQVCMDPAMKTSALPESPSERGMPTLLISQRQLLAMIPGGLSAARALASAP